MMDEPKSEGDSDFIDDVMDLLGKEETVRNERATNSCLGNLNDLNIITYTDNKPLGLLIEEAEIIFEDGLSIDDVLHEETNFSQPGTSYQNNFEEGDQPKKNIIDSSSNFNNTNGAATIITNSMVGESNSGHPNDPDVVLSDDKIMDVSSEKQTTVGPNGKDTEMEIKNNSNVDNTINEIANNTQDDFITVGSLFDDDPDDPDFVLSDDETMDFSSENHPTTGPNNNDIEVEIENNSNINNPLNELANKTQQDLCAVEVLNDEENNCTRKRKKRPDKSAWNVNIHKKLRMTGKKYLGYKKVKVDGKIKVKRSETEHEERKMGPVCNSKVCKANKKRKCTEISEEIQHNIFKLFWQLSWKEKQVYIRDHVKKCNVKQKTVKDKASRRSGSYKYYLSPTTGDLKPVCKLMFLNTLGMKEGMVQNWASNVGDVPDVEDLQHSEQEELGAGVQPQYAVEQRGSNEKNIPHKKKIIAEWFDSLPKVPSHYCRASSSKMYFLEPLWGTKVELYRSYKDFCTSNNKPYGSLTIFMQVYESKNLSLYVPKKDQCDTCYAYHAGNVSKEEHDKHINEKNVARTEKEGDKQKAIQGEIYCLTADVESVKLTPMTKASAMYYKMKLNSHNYTVYNMANRHCKCYWFSEVEGDLSANTFASCLVNYLTEHCLSPRLPIVIYTDGCTNQNRNHFVCNALLDFAIQNNITVSQKYLVKGHTQMEGDSVHAMIEKKIKGKDVYLPFEYVKYTKEARQTPFPYDAVYLKHDFFKDFSKINYYESVRPGRKKGDPCVVDVRCFQYLPKGIIQYKLSFNDSFLDLPRRPNSVKKEQKPSQLFKHRIPLSYDKWKHLQELKYVIPADYHQFYDSLPYKK